MNQPCISGINPTWLYCIIFFTVAQVQPGWESMTSGPPWACAQPCTAWPSEFAVICWNFSKLLWTSHFLVFLWSIFITFCFVIASPDSGDVKWLALIDFDKCGVRGGSGGGGGWVRDEVVLSGWVLRSDRENPVSVVFQRAARQVKWWELCGKGALKDLQPHLPVFTVA